MAKRRQNTLSDQQVADFRLRLREAMNGLSEGKFAEKAGIAQSGLHRLLNDGLPSMDVLIAIAIAAGVRVEWLATGTGPKSSVSNPALEALERSIEQVEQRVQMMTARLRVDTETMEKVARVVTEAYREAGIRIAPEKLVVEAAALFNELLARVSDPSDVEEVEATLPQLRHIMRKRLASAVNAPGTGKRLA